MGFEKYLIQLSSPDRINVCKFHCGNHKLPISVGQYLPGDALTVYVTPGIKVMNFTMFLFAHFFYGKKIEIY